MLRKYIFVIWASLQPVFEVVLEEKPFAGGGTECVCEGAGDSHQEVREGLMRG